MGLKSGAYEYGMGIEKALSVDDEGYFRKAFNRDASLTGAGRTAWNFSRSVGRYHVSTVFEHNGDRYAYRFPFQRQSLYHRVLQDTPVSRDR